LNITVLASGSKGNCYLIESGGDTLLLEAGIPFREIQRGIDFNVSKLDGCLVSHEHGDHAKAVKDLLKAGVYVYTSPGTVKEIGIKHHRLIGTRSQVSPGNWAILPFEAQHDAAEPVCFVIQNFETGDKLLYATDTTYLKYTFRGLTNVMIEANYSREIIDRNVSEGVIDQGLRDRIVRNHMSIETCLEALKANDLSRVKSIHLLHLSDQNSDEAAFKEAVQKATGKIVIVC